MNIDDVKKVTVIGAGAMGNGIAQVAMLAGFDVAMRDIKQEFVDKGMESIVSNMARMVKKEKITQEKSDECFSRLKGIVDMDDALKDADLIIEAAPEIMDLKQKIFKELDEKAPSNAILASNTSTMSISEIASATSSPQRVVGMHFFNPAVILKLVEVIRGNKSSDEAINVVRDVVLKMKKVPVIVEKDSPGFIYNRVNAPTVLLLQLILEKGTPAPEEFDATFKPFMPMAPFELLDYVGIDIGYSTQKYFSETLSKDYTPTKAFEAQVNSGNLGKKTGKGIYDWSAGKPTIDLSKATKEYDLTHMVALQVNEATKILEEKVATDPKEIDLALANGGGGIGPFAMVQAMGGYDVLVEKCNELADKFNIDVFRPTKTMKEGKIKV